MSFKYVSDISSYQPDNLAFMKRLKASGISGLMVKLTDGTSYLNPRAGSQVSNGLKVFKTVGLYHFFEGDGQAEATYFLKWVKAFGMDHTTPLAIDVEAPYLPQRNTKQINIFLRALKDAGYKCRIVYGSASWFNSKRINYDKLADKNIWVASYGGSQPGVDNASAWQFTDNFKGMHVDASYDFNGVLTGKRLANAAESENSYLSSGEWFKVVGEYVSVYKNSRFSDSNETIGKYTKGSVVAGTPEKYGDIYRIRLDNGKYTSANKEYVNRV